MTAVKLLLALCAFGSSAIVNAQPLRMYSEFRRVGPNNEIVRQDAIGDPREIISPAVLRGMHVSYRIVAATPPGMHYWMYVGANPDDVISYALYREHTAAGVPASLEKVDTPVEGTMPPQGSAGARLADTYLLDLYIPPATPASRIRIEAQLNFDNRWVIYPLEVRVLEGTLAAAVPGDAALPAPKNFTNTADASRLAFQSELCQRSSPGLFDPAARALAASLTMPSQSAFLIRNAQQDLALIRTAVSRHGQDEVVKGLVDALGASPMATFCASNTKPYNPEIILRARDFLIRNSVPTE